MYLEQKLRFAQMQKGERVDPFRTKLKETYDELFAAGHTPQDFELIRLALNFVLDEWQAFVQIILGIAALPNWDEMWAALKQEELRRDLVKVKLDGSNNKNELKPKEEDNAALASKRQQGQQRPKMDVSKVKCFRCCEIDHCASQCPLKKKDKDEKHDPKVVVAKMEQEEFTMTAEIPLGERWADLELLFERAADGQDP